MGHKVDTYSVWRHTHTNKHTNIFVQYAHTRNTFVYIGPQANVDQRHRKTAKGKGDSVALKPHTNEPNLTVTLSPNPDLNPDS